VEVSVGIAAKYAKAMWNVDSLLTTWTPDKRLEVGDVIAVESSGTITVERKLSALLDVALPPVSSTAGAESTVVQDGVSIEVGGSVQTAHATARVSLTGRESFLFSARSATLHSFDETAPLRTMLMALSALGRWDDGWQVVTAVRQYAACTVVIAETDGVQAELRTDRRSGITSLAGAAAGGHLSVTSGRAASYTLTDCTPLYEAVRVRRRLTGTRVAGARPGTRGDAVSADDHRLELASVSLSDSRLVE
jgi:hypothetical protein